MGTSHYCLPVCLSEIAGGSLCTDSTGFLCLEQSTRELPRQWGYNCSLHLGRRCHGQPH